MRSPARHRLLEPALQGDGLESYLGAPAGYRGRYGPRSGRASHLLTEIGIQFRLKVRGLGSQSSAESKVLLLRSELNSQLPQ